MSNRFFVLIHEPGSVPNRKTPYPQTMHGSVTFVVEAMLCHSAWTNYTICEVTEERDFLVEDGFAAIAMYGNRAQKAVANRIKKEKQTAHTHGRAILAASGDSHPAIRREIRS